MKKLLYWVIPIIIFIIVGILGCALDYEKDWEHNKKFTIINMNSEEGTRIINGKMKRPTVYKLLLLRSIDDTTKYLEFNADRLFNGRGLFYTKHIGDTIELPDVYKPEYFIIK